MAELEIKCLTVSSCYTNCYVCCNKDTKEGFIVDPGDDFVKITNYINSMDMKVVAIILTHGHFDHIGAVDKLKERYDLTVYASEAEKDTITDTTKNLTSYFGEPFTVTPDVYLKDGQKIEIAGILMNMILTPGHTEGSCCYYCQIMACYLAEIHYFRQAVEERIFRVEVIARLLIPLKQNY